MRSKAGNTSGNPGLCMRVMCVCACERGERLCKLYLFHPPPPHTQYTHTHKHTHTDADEVDSESDTPNRIDKDLLDVIVEGYNPIVYYDKNKAAMNLVEEDTAEWYEWANKAGCIGDVVASVKNVLDTLKRSCTSCIILHMQASVTNLALASIPTPTPPNPKSPNPPPHTHTQALPVCRYS